jgi:EmrB/QacA subfamily drug resistance transporter
MLMAQHLERGPDMSESRDPVQLAVDAAPADAAGQLDPRRWAALIVLLLAAFMDVVDVSIVLIAAPSIQSDLQTGYSAIQWVVAAYSLALGLLLITGGRLGDIVGRKRMFLAGVAAFTAASAVCAVAPSIGTLIAARAVQGAAAGLMIPQILSTVQVSFAREERPKAYGMYGAMNGLGAAAAPILGGVLVGSDVFGLGWRSVFWINVPIGVVALIAGGVLMRESRVDHRPRLDLPGVIVVSIGLLLLLYPLIQGGELGWPVWAFLMMAGSVPVFAAFAWYQNRRERVGFPLVPMSLFRQRPFVLGLIAAVVAFSTISAIFLVLTVQLQIAHQFSALKVGLIFMAWPIGLAVTSGLAVRFAATLGRRLISAGTLLLTIAMLVLIGTIQAIGADLEWWHLLPGLALGGLGFGLVAPILVDVVLSGVSHRDAGAASGVTNTGIYVGIAAGIAVVGALFTTFLRDSGDFDQAAAQSLWYAVAAFAVSFGLSFALPAASGQTKTGGDEPGT